MIAFYLDTLLHDPRCGMSYSDYRQEFHLFDATIVKNLENRFSTFPWEHLEQLAIRFGTYPGELLQYIPGSSRLLISPEQASIEGGPLLPPGTRLKGDDASYYPYLYAHDLTGTHMVWKLNEIRKSRGLSVPELSQLLQIPLRTTFRRCPPEGTPVIKKALLDRICYCLDVPVGELLVMEPDVL